MLRLAAPGSVKLLKLAVKGLPVGADNAGIAAILEQNSGTEKRKLFSALGLFHIFLSFETLAGEVSDNAIVENGAELLENGAELLM
jgi:hypothetical protein